MTRKLFGAALAVALAGGVYLSAASPAQASNMGFKLEREFAPVSGFANLFYVSFPLFNGLGDVADENWGGDSPCIGDTGGPTAGDGEIDSFDAICDLWTDRSGQFTFARYDIATCTLETMSAVINPFGGFTFSGTWRAALPSDEAFQVQQTFPPAGSPTNASVIVGSHDPSYTGRLLQPNATCRADLQLALINLPYHTMYQNAIEILCGLKGVDWMDTDGDGVPEWIDVDGDTVEDPCPNGIFDGDTAIAVQWFDNVDDNSGPGGGDTDNQSIVCSVRGAPFPGQPPIFPDGTGCYDLIPGEGYIVQMQAAHAGTTFLSPHF